MSVAALVFDTPQSRSTSRRVSTRRSLSRDEHAHQRDGGEQETDAHRLPPRGRLGNALPWPWSHPAAIVYAEDHAAEPAEKRVGHALGLLDKSGTGTTWLTVSA